MCFGIKADRLNIHHRVFNLLSSENALFMMCSEWERVLVQNVQMFAAVDLGECLKVNEIF